MAIEIYICGGSRCRKHSAEIKDLHRALKRSASVKRVKCQKICKGPVVGLRVSGELQWFRKCKSQSDVVDLVDLVQGGRPSKKLREKRVDKRAKKLR